MGKPDAKELAKEMEKKFWGDLQERLDEVKQHPLPYTYQKPERCLAKPPQIHTRRF